MAELHTTIGLEIHVQLATKSKMFCRCDNNAEGKRPNTTICPICLGMPGALPVANKEAILSTIKTGLALDCQIAKISKFDRKHYFYPDLPKGYQISQYDEPFCVGGFVEISASPADGDGEKIRLNRIHLEEDAGKLIHKNGKSLVDLNRAGTPLMEIVTEPDIKSSKQAGDFMRKLQKIVRDVVAVSEASMEKGHLRCDANISVTDGKRMSEIVEIKNLNSFRFVEKALMIEEERLKAEYPNWPEKKGKVTRGYDSVKNITFVQRRKEEAADYRYFPEPDLPPFDTSEFDLKKLKSEIGEEEDTRIEKFISLGIDESDARVLARDSVKEKMFQGISQFTEQIPLAAKVIVHNYFNGSIDAGKSQNYAKIINCLAEGKISKATLPKIGLEIQAGKNIDEILSELSNNQISESEIEQIVDHILTDNPKEAEACKNGKKQLIGFFVGETMKTSKGKADPKLVNKILQQKLKSVGE